MKDRSREAVFNLIGPSIKGSHAIDLFSGTGALALEAISRGSLRATAIERHFPTAKMVTENARDLGIGEQVVVVPGDTFIWARRLPDLGSDPWVVFCSPPYALYQERTDDMLLLLQTLIDAAPERSQFLVEADSKFNWEVVPNYEAWDIRYYSPAAMGLWKKPSADR